VNDEVWGTATDEYVNDDVNVYVLAELCVDVLVGVIGCSTLVGESRGIWCRRIDGSGGFVLHLIVHFVGRSGIGKRRQGER
jgi:hypothetical protein